MRVGDARVDRLDAFDGQNIPGRRTGELVGAVRRADGDGERIDLRRCNKVGGLFRIGEQLRMVEHTFRADAVFLTGSTGLERAEAAQLTLDRDATRVRHGDHLARHADVVVVIGRRLAVGAKAAVHHHAGEAELDRALADGRAGAVVLVHAHRDVRELLDGGEDEVAQERRTRVLTSASRGLHDHWRVSFVCRLHDGAHLLEVVDVEGRHAVAVFGGVVEHLAERDERHECVSYRIRMILRVLVPPGWPIGSPMVMATRSPAATTSRRLSSSPARSSTTSGSVDASSKRIG